MWLLWKGVELSDIHCQLLQFVERAPACSTVITWVQSFSTARKLHRWLSMSGIATLLKNGAMKPFGSS